EHDAHAVGMPAIYSLEIAVIERVLPQHSDNAFNNVFIRNRPVLLDAFGSVLLVLTAEPHNDVSDRLAEVLILSLIALLESLQFREPFFFKPISFGPQAIRFLMIERTHEGFGDGCARAQNALLATTRARTIARDERFVIAPHHEVIAECRFARI